MYCIQLPTFLASEKELKSRNMEKLFNEQDILVYLRKMYLEDKSFFFDIIDELKLRGIAISLEISSNLFPKEVLGEPYLLVEQSGDKFTQVNFDLLGLNLFVHRFSVMDDEFFNYVPLEGFIKLNKALNMETIVDVFNEAKFKIVGYTSMEKYKPSENDVLVIKEVKEDNRFIRQVFSDKKYFSFLRYCAKKNLEYMSDLNGKYIEEYRSFHGVGAKRYNDVLIKWNEQLNYSEEDKNNSQSAITYKFEIQTTIEDAFNSVEYRSFVEFCKKIKIQYLTELHPIHIDEYSNKMGVGPRKVKLVEQEIENLLEREELYINSLNQTITNLSIYPVIEKLSIGEIVTILELDIQFELTEEESYFNSIAIDSLSSEKRLSIFKELMYLMPLHKVANELRSSVTEREMEVLTLRANPTETLESIGKKIGVTRERARQIIAKSKAVVLRKANTMLMYKTLKLMKSEKFGISEEEIKRSLLEENSYLLPIIQEISDGFIYIPQIKVYLSKEEENLFSELVEEIHRLPEVLSIEEFHSYINELIENKVSLENEKELQNYLLVASERKKYGSYVSTKSLSLVNKLELIFKDHLYEPLLLDENGKITIDNLCIELFGSSIGDSLRAIQARVRDVEKVILVDNLTFQWIDELILEEKLFDNIEIFINKQLITKTHINAEDIFKEFEDQVKRLGIDNKIHLYSIVKYLFGSQYKIGKGNTLNIYRVGTTVYSLDEKLEKTLIKAEKDYTITELAKKLSYQKSTIDLLISKSDKYVTWDDDRVRLISSLGITESETVKLQKFIDQYMNEGFSTTFKLFQECQFDDEMSVFLQDHEIKTDYVLGSIIKTLIPKIKGHTVFLYNKKSGITSMEEAVKTRFSTNTTRKEITDYILSYGYSIAASYQIIYSLIRKKDYVLIDTDTLYNSSQLNISQEIKVEVQKYIEKQMEEKEYLIISQIMGYRRNLPEIEYHWKPHLIHTIALEIGYRHIKTSDDYRYDRLVIVRKDSIIKEFDEIVYTELVENYEGAFQEIEVAKHLKKIGLLWSDERLPFELSNSRFFQIDEVGRITIQGG